MPRPPLTPPLEGLWVMRWPCSAREPPRTIKLRAMLAVPEPEVITPQQLKPQPVGALRGPLLPLKRLDECPRLARRQGTCGEPGRPLAGVVHAHQAIARGLVAVWQAPLTVTAQMRQSRALATVESFLMTGEGGACITRKGVGSGLPRYAVSLVPGRRD